MLTGTAAEDGCGAAARGQPQLLQNLAPSVNAAEHREQAGSIRHHPCRADVEVDLRSGETRPLWGANRPSGSSGNTIVTIGKASTCEVRAVRVHYRQQMEVLAVVLFCLLLLLLMRSVGAVLGQSIGTLAGIGCIGAIGFAVMAGIVLLLMPLVIAGVIVVGICYVGATMLRKASNG